MEDLSAPNALVIWQGAADNSEMKTKDVCCGNFCADGSARSNGRGAL